MHTAAIITARCSTMPTAVITESSENTASSTTIWITTGQNLAPLRWLWLSWSLPSSRSFNSTVALKSKNIPPVNIIRSRALKPCPLRVRIGLVSVASQEMDASSTRRITSASNKPTIRALSRCWRGSFSAKIAIKTRLSIPSTISSTTSVASPAQIVGSAIHSIRFVIPSELLQLF